MFGKNQITGQKAFKDVGDKLLVTSIFYTIQGEGPFAGHPAIFVRLANCNLACSFCFPQNTYINMVNGKRKKIKDITIGDQVVSWDEKNQQFVTGVVSETFKRSVDQLVKIETGPNDLIYSSIEHPFLVKGKGWVKACDLIEGDVLLHLSSSDRMKFDNPTLRPVTSINLIDKESSPHAWTQLAGNKQNQCEVYNFEVANYHTYVANGKIVHNCDAYFDSGDWIALDDLKEQIVKIVNENDKKTDDLVFVVTGGEPMLQKNVVPLLEWANTIFYTTQMESNGLLTQPIPPQTYLVVSPKCNEKTNKYYKLPKATLERVDCFKFVMSADQNSPYSQIPEWALSWKEANLFRTIYVSPMNVYNKEPQKARELRATKNSTTMEERSTIDETVSFWEDGLLNMEVNKANHEYAARYCLKHNLIFNLQLHLYAGLA